MFSSYCSLMDFHVDESVLEMEVRLIKPLWKCLSAVVEFGLAYF